MEQKVKHVLIVTHYYPPHIGGIEIVARNQASVLAARGYSVTVVTSGTPFEKSQEIIDGVNIIRVPAWNILEKWGVPFPLFSLRLWTVLFRASQTADIVHAHDAFYISSFFAALAAWWNKKTFVLTQHVALIQHPHPLVTAVQKIVYATTGALIFNISQSIIVYNNRVKKFLIDRGVSSKKCITLPNGVDTQIFHPVSQDEQMAIKKEYGLGTGKKILLFVGRFVPKKGFDLVLSMHSSEYTIVCVGGDTPQNNFGQSYKNVHFLGKLDQKNLARVYQMADIFILPSESEGFPLSIQEAMASGLPVITTRDDGYAQYDLDENMICFIDKPDRDLLRTAINSLISDDQKLAAMSTYGHTYAESHFSWPVAVSSLEKIYTDALHPQKKIALVSDAVYPYNTGGKEMRIHEISKGLAARGYDVTLYCMHWWNGGNTVTHDGVTFTAISPYFPLYTDNRRSMSEAILFALHCLKMVTKDFDVIEVDHMPHLVLFTIKIVCLIRRKKMIVTWHEVWGTTYWKKYLGTAGIIAAFIEWWSAHLPDTIISVSEHTTRALHDMIGSKKEIVTIPNGINTEDIAKNSPAASGTDIVFAGRLLAHKNVDVLLKAVGIVSKQNPTISLTIIGEGPERVRLETLARELGITKNVSFQNFFQKHSDLYSFMRASGIFVLPSTREGFGIVVLEANASGMPVVVVKDPENAAVDLIEDGKNGVLTTLDENDMERAIEKALEIKKGQPNYSAYLEKYNWDNLISDVVAVYNKNI